MFQLNLKSKSICNQQNAVKKTTKHCRLSIVCMKKESLLVSKQKQNKKKGGSLRAIGRENVLNWLLLQPYCAFKKKEKQWLLWSFRKPKAMVVRLIHRGNTNAQTQKAKEPLFPSLASSCVFQMFSTNNTASTHTFAKVYTRKKPWLLQQ